MIQVDARAAKPMSALQDLRNSWDLEADSAARFGFKLWNDVQVDQIVLGEATCVFCRRLVERRQPCHKPPNK